MKIRFWAIGAVAATMMVLAAVFFQPWSRAIYAPSSGVLTKEQVIERSIAGMKNAEVLESRLVLHDEAARATGAGEFDYESGFFEKDDPVWILAIRADNANEMMADIGQGDVNYTGMIKIINAADSELLVETIMPDDVFADRVKRIQALQDRTGLIEIIPRTRQPLLGDNPDKSTPPILPTPTNTALPVETAVPSK